VHTYDWGGDGPPLVFAHATGLHSHVWIPLVTRMRAYFHCYGVDVRAQGNTSAPANDDFAWSNITEDFVRALDSLQLSGRGDVFGIGHSQGGYSVLSAAMERPGTFRHIFGFEPVLFPPPPGAVIGARFDNPMAEMVKRRREIFASRVAAYENFRAKPPFQSADDDVIRSYVQWGFHDLPDGTVRLKCRAENESALFANSVTDLLQRVGKIDCDVALGLSELTSPNFTESIPMQHEQIAHSTLMHFPGRTHFGVLEGTDEIASMLIKLFLGLDT
jgi:pimeloyl-ACP methyl ester carboxylesterase